jgi:ABC-type nitrate/sulfonate/bicarbonate transport system ATPase subunit
VRKKHAPAHHHRLEQPTSGVVLYRDNVVNGVNPHATIVFQTFALFPWLTVQQNVEIALKVRVSGERPRRCPAR